MTTDRLSKRVDTGKTAGLQPHRLHKALPLLPDDPRSVGLVNDQPRAEPPAQFRHPRERRLRSFTSIENTDSVTTNIFAVAVPPPDPTAGLSPVGPAAPL